MRSKSVVEMEPPEKVVGVHPETGVVLRRRTNAGD
jgi:hypothetical protein